ncbi:MAG: DNA repair protein RadA [Ilumatobacter sp.]|uniref:DNA repair protein RadA n=1 Tax=Ilumatobacter sp. TaxID=1967498 RepID=UPI00260EAC6C|nr:DNA repair protein RadA [Ilumatobacter sp.]MDJ0767993.1 DNA repair protein RadA [Ilumatobacter sp.]
MAKSKIEHVCSACGASHPKWSGQCTSCGEWNTLVEEFATDPLPVIAPALSAPQPIGDVDPHTSAPVPTGLDELDRVLGGGLVAGSVTLLGGEPGIGKSTLLLQLLAERAGRALYVTAEESAQQVRQRAERLGAVRPELLLQAETALPHITAAVADTAPGIVVVDSIQTVHDPALGSPPGSVVQVRGCAQQLVQIAKQRNVPIVLVGHVTKEGSLAGPRVLEHVVDTVLAFEGERHHALRLLRASKHRFGPTNELGLFEMAGHGLIGVPDPSELFLGDRRTGVPGSAIVPTVEGQRPLVIEVQALTTPAPPNVPARRTTQGVDTNRLALLLAVLQQRARVDVRAHDVYASTVGGVRLAAPGLDLGVCLSVVSAVNDRPLPADLVAFGEVGLGGEVRQVAHAPRRAAEAARLGFRRAIVPRSSPDADGLHLVRVATIAEALAAAGL